MTVKKVYKRDGRLVEFDKEKIKKAMHKAFKAVGVDDSKYLKRLTQKVVTRLEKKFKRHPHVEEIQDMVENVLMKEGYERTARAYIKYRRKHADIRETKDFMGITKDEFKMDVNAAKVLQKRYLLKDEKGKVIESPKQMFRRVARHVAGVEAMYGGNPKDREKEFYEMMTDFKFLPNSPTLMNAGTEMGQLSACFVLPVPDSMEGIFNTLKNMAQVHQSGGGTGFSFSRIRPHGDIVKSTKGTASGPVSFMKVYDKATDVVKQGGRRRGANMAVLDATHPDIEKFVTVKKDPEVLNNFNISVAVTDRFMQAVKKGKDYPLVNPRTGKKVRAANAKDMFRLMTTMAWNNGDPGMIFIDEINRHNPTPEIGKIESTNPCGEQPLLPYESCNLGSVNLGKFVKNRRIQWKEMETTLEKAVRFLDNVIDANKYPLKEIEEMTKANRKIGLGVMGFADMLVKLGVPYDSKKAVSVAKKVMSYIEKKARQASSELAEERGSFPNFKKSRLKKKLKRYKRMRNASLTTIAPTGTISIIGDCSSGIEPLFGISFVRNVLEGTQLLEVNNDFKKTAKEKGFYSKGLMLEIAKEGTVKRNKKVPKKYRKIFVTSMDIRPEWHIKIQAAFQKHTDAAVSKTINFPSTATIKDVERAYLLAHKMKCKGITIYRYGSREGQVLSYEDGKGDRQMQAEAEYSGGCLSGDCPF